MYISVVRKDSLRRKMIHEDRNFATTPNANFGQLIFELPPTIRRILRRVESLSKKIINTVAAISFNKIYIFQQIRSYSSNLIEEKEAMILTSKYNCFTWSNK
jgi:hypothetical protein